METALIVAVLGGLFSIAVILITKYVEGRASSRSANIAVLAEIRRLLVVLKRHKDWWERCIASGDTDLPLVPFTTPVFDEQVKTIGNVDKAIVAKVVAFYGYVKFINAVQGQRAQYAAIGKQETFTRQYHEILKRAVSDYGGGFEAAFTSYALAAEPGAEQG